MCCCFLVFPVLPSRIASGLSIYSWGTPWRGNLRRRDSVSLKPLKRLSPAWWNNIFEVNPCLPTTACVTSANKRFPKTLCEKTLILTSLHSLKCVWDLKPPGVLDLYTPLNFLGGLARSPASGWITHLSSTSLQRTRKWLLSSCKCPVTEIYTHPTVAGLWYGSKMQIDKAESRRGSFEYTV